MGNSFTELLAIDLPIVQAPMGGATTPELAAAVSNAGGLGMLALGWSTPEAVRDEIRATKALTGRPFGVNLVLTQSQEERLALALSEGVDAISFFWGRAGQELVETAHRGGAKVLHTVSSAIDARRVADDGVDVVVAQGWEAGGHVHGSVATLALVPAVVDRVGKLPVLAAGGIADGRGLVAALALGAAGAWIGTRFLASHEAATHPRYRALLLAACETETEYGTLFDVTWPDAPHRTLRNSTIRAWEALGRPHTGGRPGEGEIVGQWAAGHVVRYQAHTPTRDTEGDIEAMALWAGQAVALVHKTQPAADIVRDIAAEATAILRQLAIAPL